MEQAMAFLNELDPATGDRWSDRYGIVYRGRAKTFENVEPHLHYKKLNRTGAMLRANKVNVRGGNRVVSTNTSPYAQAQHEGSETRVGNKAYIKKGGAVRGIVLGKGNVARPWMYPSKRILWAYKTFVGRKMKSFGW